MAALSQSVRNMIFRADTEEKKRPVILKSSKTKTIKKKTGLSKTKSAFNSPLVSADDNERSLEDSVSNPKDTSPPTSSSKDEPLARPIKKESKAPTAARRLKVAGLTNTRKKKAKFIHDAYLLTRPSHNPLNKGTSARVRFHRVGLVPVTSYWRPPIQPSMESPQDGVAVRSQKKQEREERVTMGLPRNVQPVTITTRYRQFKLEPANLLKGCRSDSDRRFMNMVTRNGRLLPIDRWKCYTLVQAETFQHDMGTFVALDLALLTLILNFYNDMRRLLQGRRQKIRVDDVRYLIDNVWGNQVVNASKILVPQFKTSKPIRLRHRKDENAMDIEQEEAEDGNHEEDD